MTNTFEVNLHLWRALSHYCMSSLMPAVRLQTHSWDLTEWLSYGLAMILEPLTALHMLESRLKSVLS